MVLSRTDGTDADPVTVVSSEPVPTSPAVRTVAVPDTVAVSELRLLSPATPTEPEPVTVADSEITCKTDTVSVVGLDSPAAL